MVCSALPELRWFKVLVRMKISTGKDVGMPCCDDSFDNGSQSQSLAEHSYSLSFRIVSGKGRSNYWTLGGETEAIAFSATAVAMAAMKVCRMLCATGFWLRLVVTLAESEGFAEEIWPWAWYSY